jgi:hypothetical protein
MAVDLKKYDFPQVLRSVFDDNENTLRVSVVAGAGGGTEVEVSVNHTDDSIRLGNGTTLFTGTTVGPKTGLDVNVINNPLNVIVSNEVEVTNDAGNPLPVNGTVTANLGTLNGAATAANQTTTNTTLSSLLTELQQKTEPTDTQPISAASLPLPTGASTSALQTAGNSSLSSIDTKLTSPLAVTGPLTDTQLRASVVPVSLSSTTISNFPANQDVTVTSSVLPTGAATSANQTAANASLSSIDSKLTSPITVQSTNLDIRDLVFSTDKIDASGSSVSVSNFPAVQPVSDNGGSLTVDGTVELGATSLVALENITATVSGAIDLSTSTLAALENVSIDNFPSNQNVTVTSSALPTGAATSANQTTANVSLSSIDSKLTSPLTVQSTNLDIRDLTFAADKVDVSGSSISVTNFPATQNVNVTNSSIAVTGPLTDTQLRATPVPVSGTVTANLGTIAGVSTETTLSALNTKVPSNLTVTSTRLLVDGSGVTQPVSAVSLPLPTGASTSANQVTTNTNLVNIETNQTDGTQRTQITNGTNNADVINSNPVASTQALVVRAIPYRPATFTVTGTQVTLGNQKSLIAIQNTGTSVVRISKIYLTNTQNTGVTGVVANIRLQRIASFTGGSALSSFPHNTLNVLPAGISFATNSTIASESALFRDSFWSSDEWGPGTADVESNDHARQELQPWYKTEQGEQGITLIQNQGLHVKCNTNTTAGNFTITVVFTVEDV